MKVTQLRPFLRPAFYTVGIILFLYCLFLSSYHLLIGDIEFHTDIARDVLLVENMVTTHHIDLLGPRAGGIQGLFFGPLWYYLMIPFFIVGSGNPLTIGIFWFVMVLLSLVTVFFVSKKLFGLDTALLSTLLYAAVMPLSSQGFTQSFGSLILSPVIFYLLYRLYTKTTLWTTCILVLLLGVEFQFQPAFAMIMIVLSGVYTAALFFVRKKLLYLFSYGLLVLPLANFIFFDLRHGFLQTRSFVQFLSHPSHNATRVAMSDILSNRLDGFLNGLTIIGSGVTSYRVLFFLLFAGLLFLVWKKKDLKPRAFYFLFFGFYLGFWLVTFLFKGTVWGYYYWAFMPLVFMVFASLFRLIDKRIFFLLYAVVLFLLLSSSTQYVQAWASGYANRNESSWKLNEKVAKAVFADAQSTPFGYFVYSPDEFGYSMKYAMNFVQRSHSNTPVTLCQKKQRTYLIYYPTPAANAKTDPTFWKKVRVGITALPVRTFSFADIKVERYQLDSKEIAKPSDPNLICTLQFR